MQATHHAHHRAPSVLDTVAEQYKTPLRITNGSPSSSTRTFSNSTATSTNSQEIQFSNAFLAVVLVTTSLFASVDAFNGEATYFELGLGACGLTNKASDLIIALSSPQYGNGSHCSKNIRAHYQGKSVVAKVVDRCPGCAPDDIDLSPSAFERLANKDLGRIKVDWEFI